jgi:hypothetical protein
LEHLLAAQAAQSPGRATQQADATQFGTFTTDTHSSRYIKVSGSNIATFLPTVEASKKVWFLCLFTFASPTIY